MSLWRKLTQKISGRRRFRDAILYVLECVGDQHIQEIEEQNIYISQTISFPVSYSRHMERANARRHGEAPTPQGIMFRCTDKKIQTRHNQG